MGKIQVLDDLTINQIAAGEVIDRPASVVKELIENAIDAKADAVTVEIKDGGTSLIRITDNGSGIDKEDIKTAFCRHATSKIKTAEDLLCVSSLGFRGEALSSIASVAMVELISKTKSSMMGCRYEINGGVEGVFEEVGVPDGTTFLVRNLFYHTPARKKFLKSPATEAGYIADVVQRLALSHPDVSVRFINNGKHVLHTSGNGNLKDVIYQIYGRDAAANLLEIEAEGGLFRFRGFLGKPLIARGNRSFETYFINGRYIKSNIISKAIEEGYKNFMMQHKYPFTVLHFSIEPELIDVNVHPAKMEIRFRNGEELYDMVSDAVKHTLSGKDLTVEVDLQNDKKPKQTKKSKETVEKDKENHLEQPVSNREKQNPVPEILNTEILQDKALKPFGTVSGTITIPTKTTEQKDIRTTQKNYTEPLQNPKTSAAGNILRETIHFENRQTEQAEKKIYGNSIPEDKHMMEPVSEKKSENVKNEQLSLFDDKLLSKEARQYHKMVGQVFDTYWIVEYGEKMFLIDQHAAHEKILFERMMKHLKEKEILSQELNPPIILSLSMREGEIVRQYRKELSKLGYDISEFGGNDYAVHTVPFDLYALTKEELLMELIDSITEEGSFHGSSELLLEKIASMACKAAVKGNHRLSPAEADALIGELLTLENPYNCPHGRPTIVSMSKQELEKKFKRIV